MFCLKVLESTIIQLFILSLCKQKDVLCILIKTKYVVCYFYVQCDYRYIVTLLLLSLENADFMVRYFDCYVILIHFGFGFEFFSNPSSVPITLDKRHYSDCLQVMINIFLQWML